MAVCCSLRGQVCCHGQALDSVARKLVQNGQGSTAVWEVAALEGRQPALVDLAATNVGGPAPTCSRQGRDKQLYTEDGARLVAG